MFFKKLFFVVLVAFLMIGGCAIIGNDGYSLFATNNYYNDGELELVLAGANESVSLAATDAKKYDLEVGVDFGLLITEDHLIKDGKEGFYIFLNGKEIGFIQTSGKVIKDGELCKKQREQFKKIIEEYLSLRSKNEEKECSDIPDPASK